MNERSDHPMHHIASYPLTEQALTPYIGRSVVGITHHGDRFVGTLQSCSEGQIYLVPIQRGAASAAVKSFKKQFTNHPQVKKHNSKTKHRTKISKNNMEKAKLSFWGPGWGLGGAGFGFGLAAGIGFAIPLLVISALFAAPIWI